MGEPDLRSNEDRVHVLSLILERGHNSEVLSAEEARVDALLTAAEFAYTARLDEFYASAIFNSVRWTQIPPVGAETAWESWAMRNRANQARERAAGQLARSARVEYINAARDLLDACAMRLPAHERRSLAHEYALSSHPAIFAEGNVTRECIDWDGVDSSGHEELRARLVDFESDWWSISMAMARSVDRWFDEGIATDGASAEVRRMHVAEFRGLRYRRDELSSAMHRVVADAMTRRDR